MNSTAEIDGALRWLDPDVPREEWVRILMGIKSALGDDGRDVAKAWSAGGHKYSRAAFRDTWKSLRGSGVTALTIFRMALDNGWEPSAKPDEETSRRPPQRPVDRVREQPATLPFARAIWQRVKRDDHHVSQHPYCVRKCIRHAAGAGRATVSSPRIGQNIDCIVVPYRTLDGEFVGVECIDPDGRKTTLGSKGVLVLGNDLDRTLPVLVVEGWATAVHTLAAYRWNACAVAAGGKHRLNRVAQELDQRDPSRRIVVCMEVDL